jgi:prolyl-tRNA editing enzyme YbaK/EbsC (Cys-tRNA(Pro) deacylase)
VFDPILNALDAMSIDYEVIDCDPQLADTAEFCEHYGYRLDESANAIMVVGKGEPRKYAMCVVLANTQIDVNKVVRKKIGTKKASFAPPAEALEITGMTLGGITPFGLPKDLPLWIDNRVMACTKVIVGGGSRDRKIFLPPKGLEALPNAEVVDGLAKEK